jgi:hypothetical protein
MRGLERGTRLKSLADRLGTSLFSNLAVVLAGILVIILVMGFRADAQEAVSRKIPSAEAASKLTAGVVSTASELPDSPRPSAELVALLGESTSIDGATAAALDPSAVPSPEDPYDDEPGRQAREFFLGSKENSVPRSLAAPTYHRYILPDEIAQSLTPRQRVIFGFHQALSPFFLLTIVAASGYEQAVNGSPNYGSNFTAYGQRLGAAAIRNASQSIFSDSLMAPLLHEDPRYYILGDRHNAVVRTLNNAYYPAVNVGFRQTGRSFEGSLIGAGLGNIVREFLPDMLRAARLGRFE